MALVVDTTKKYRNVPDGQNFTFSLSKPLNQLTAADLQSADSWVGFNCCSINQIYEGKGGEGIPENNPNYCNLWGTDPSWWYDQTNWASVHWSFPANQPNGVYMRNVYVNRELNPGDYTVANSTARIVLEITPDENTTIQKLCMIDNSNYLQAEYNTSSYDNQMADYTYISPAVLMVVNNCVYLINQNIERFFVPDNIGFYINSTTDQGYQTYFPSFENLAYHKLAMGWTMGYTTGSIEDNCVKTGTGSAPIYTYNDVDFNGHTGILTLSGGGSNYHIRIGCSMSANADDSDFSLIHRAYSGMRFKVNGIWYKPIVEGGIVTGYTDDMTVESEWDNWTKASGHNVPVGPPGPPSPTPGVWDDMPGSGSSIGALAGARCYICSKTDITNLKTWMSKTEADGGPPDGYDVLSSLISVMAFPIDMTAASSGPATAISFTGLKTSTDNQLANIATALLSIANSVGAVPKTEIKTFTSTVTAFPSAGNPFTIDLGTCDCPTFYSSDFPFADYDASVELYLPFIGTMSLDTQTVMGKSLHAYMSVDPITGAIYAWCECTKDGSRVVVASGSGAFGVNTPITANQVGMAMAQIKNNAAQTRQTAIQSALTLGVGAFAGMDKNISSVLMKHMTSGNKNIAIAGARDYMDALSVGASQAAMTAIPNAIGANLNSGRANRQIAQANHNSVTGSAGGSTADWSCSYTPYLKVITPDIHRAGEQYEHTYGVPTIQSGTLSSFSGLTFCANPDVSSISTATDQEKQQIFGLLTGGVYV